MSWAWFCYCCCCAALRRVCTMTVSHTTGSTLRRREVQEQHLATSEAGKPPLPPCSIGQHNSRHRRTASAESHKQVLVYVSSVSNSAPHKTHLDRSTTSAAPPPAIFSGDQQLSERRGNGSLDHADPRVRAPSFRLCSRFRKC